MVMHVLIMVVAEMVHNIEELMIPTLEYSNLWLPPP